MTRHVKGRLWTLWPVFLAASVVLVAVLVVALFPTPVSHAPRVAPHISMPVARLLDAVALARTVRVVGDGVAGRAAPPATSLCVASGPAGPLRHLVPVGADSRRDLDEHPMPGFLSHCRRYAMIEQAYDDKRSAGSTLRQGRMT
jgi:hypothetical protein